MKLLGFVRRSSRYRRADEPGLQECGRARSRKLMRHLRSPGDSTNMLLVIFAERACAAERARACTHST
eukprot:2656997-Prymnesium_polylepis.1